jgi:hypothetical protein
MTLERNHTECPESAGSFVVSLNTKEIFKLEMKDHMSTHPTTSEYMLLFRGTNWDEALSPEEIQEIMSRWGAWMDRLTQQGKVKGAQPLDRHCGKIVSWKKGGTVVDGPLAESKEAIGGYFLLQLNSLEEAVEIAKECPALEYGLQVEVRLIVDQCSILRRRKEELAEAIT